MRGQNQVLSSFYFELERVRVMARKKTSSFEPQKISKNWRERAEFEF